MGFWGEYYSYNDFKFLRDAYADKRRDNFIKHKMSKRQNKTKRGKRK